MFTKWMNLESIMLIEISQSQKENYHMVPYSRLIFLFTIPYCLVYELGFHLLSPGMMMEGLKELLRGQLGLVAPHSSQGFSVSLWFKHWQLLTQLEGKHLGCPTTWTFLLAAKLEPLTSHPDGRLRPFPLLLVTNASELRTPKTTILTVVIPPLLCLAVVFSNNPILFAYYFQQFLNISGLLVALAPVFQWC